MSATTSLVKQLVSEPPAANTTDSTDAPSGGQSLSEVKAAAKEGAAEALAEYHRATQDDGSATAAHDDRDSQGRSQGRSTLKRGALLGLVVVYLIRRRRSSTQSSDAQ